MFLEKTTFVYLSYLFSMMTLIIVILEGYYLKLLKANKVMSGALNSDEHKS